jgi:predicted DNA-binding WGR domain protein
MPPTIYINNEEQHNKFWQYEVNGNTVNIEYGRIGGTSQTQTKQFNSSSEVQEFIDKKVREKEKKKYKLSSQDGLNQETKTANTLGTQHKIKRMLWVSMAGDTLTEISKYDPNQYVYVEILNSWSKKLTRLILSQDDTYMVTGPISESGQNINYSTKQKLGFSSFATAVRQILNDMSLTVAEVLKTVKFAAGGVRNLFDDEDSAESINLYEKVNTSSFDRQVVSKFAAMGSRVLTL